MMRTISKSLLLFMVLTFFTGCETTTITNLTPSALPRDPSGQYLIQMQIDTVQQSLIPSSLTNTVVVGFDSYPMKPTKKSQNRWEAYVPIPGNKSSITYHYKVDYDYRRFGKPGQGSLISPEYTLTIK